METGIARGIVEDNMLSVDVIFKGAGTHYVTKQ